MSDTATDVSDFEALERVLADFQSRLHTSFPAQVTAYDAAKQTVDVMPGLQREFASDDPEQPWEMAKLPELRNVQIQWPRAGGFAITFPIAVGDWVEITCASQSTLVWRRKGEPNSVPGLNDPHGLNGCVAKPGWFPDAKKLTSVSGANVELRNEDGTHKVSLSPAGEIDVVGTLLRLGSATASQSALKGQDWQTAFNTWKTALDTYLAAIVGAAGIGGAVATPTATYGSASTALTTQLAAALSTKVKVE